MSHKGEIITILTDGEETTAVSTICGQMNAQSYTNYVNNLRNAGYILRFGKPKQVSENVRSVDLFVR